MASGVWRTSEARLLSDAPGVDPAPGVQPPADKYAFNIHLPRFPHTASITTRFTDSGRFLHVNSRSHPRHFADYPGRIFKGILEVRNHQLLNKFIFGLMVKSGGV